MKKTVLFACILIGCYCNANSQPVSESDSVPVRVSYFNAGQTANKTTLNWKVVCFLQYANFEIQRSANGLSYTTVKTFTADKIRCQSPFNFEEPFLSGATYYRLRVGDKDGNFATSKVVVAFGNQKSFEINSLTPNRVENNTVLSVSSADAGNAEISVINFQGVIVKRIQTYLAKGNTDLKLNLNALSKGLYLLQLSNKHSNTRLIQFIKV